MFTKPYRTQEIETQKPVLQIGNLLFQGTFEPFLGTAVCFQQADQNKPTTSSDGRRHSVSLEFLSKSDLKLPMKRVYLERKKVNEEEVETENPTNPEEAQV